MGVEPRQVGGDGMLWAPWTLGAGNRCAPGTSLPGRKDPVGLWGQKEAQGRLLGQHCWLSARSLP